MNPNHRRALIVASLAALCFAPAIIVGAINAPRVTPAVLAGPFKMAPKENIQEGSAFPAPQVEDPAPKEPNVITVPMVYISGSLTPVSETLLPKQEKETEVTETKTSSFIHESANGGMVRVTGFEPNH